MLIRRVQAPRIDFQPLRQELRLPAEFPADALAEAKAAAAVPPLASHVDRTDIAFVTIDPLGSRDLDQAMWLGRTADGGFQVRYAIADVAAFVRPDGALAREGWRRGQTVYLPDGNIPLHPHELSEGAASLLPDVVRPAVLWSIDLTAEGAVTGVHLERALVRSRAQLDYDSVGAGELPAAIAALPELGKLLIQQATARGAINLPIPEQELVADGDGYRLVLRQPSPIEDYNAQISLLTGMCAADIMRKGGVGLLRTMPPPPAWAIGKLRDAARALGISWPDGAAAGVVIAAADPGDPRGAAFLDHAAELLRGAAYTPFDGAAPAQVEHAGVAAPYAHVTAPLRRLADRYATEICLALFHGQPVPEWARQALPGLPKVMSDSGRMANTADRAAVDLAEAVVLEARVGETFDVVVIDLDDPRPGRPAIGGMVALADPAVRARCRGELPLGERINVTLRTADPVRREVIFAHP